MSYDSLSLTSTHEVITQSWSQAERKTTDEVCEFYQGAGEEFITVMFHGQFNHALQKASESGEIERAFLQDLQRFLSTIDRVGRLENFESGIFAQCHLHNKVEEGKSGGDMALALSEPTIYYDGFRFQLSQ